MDAQAGKKAIMFQISGLIGTALFFVVYKFLLEANPFELYKAGVTWAVSYALSIVWQHALHRFLVYGSAGDYRKSLALTFMCYSLSLGLSSVLNEVFVSGAGLSVRPARLRGPLALSLTRAARQANVSWVACLASTGVINYFTVSKAFEASETGDAPKMQ